MLSNVEIVRLAKAYAFVERDLAQNAEAESKMARAERHRNRAKGFEDIVDALQNGLTPTYGMWYFRRSFGQLRWRADREREKEAGEKIL